VSKGVRHWAGIAESMERIAGCAPSNLAAWQLEKLQAIIAHHARVDGAYASMLRTGGLNGKWELRSLEELSALPTIDKEFLREHKFSEMPSTDAPVTIVSTSGTTSSTALIPHNEESLRSGLGDNFARAFIAGGVGADERFWLTGHWDISDHQVSLGATGSFLSMYWLKEMNGEGVLLHSSQIDSSLALDEAIGFSPTVIASSPNLLTRLAREAILKKKLLKVKAVLYGGAAATDSHRAAWKEAFSPDRVIAFYPTTDAGALGVSPADDGSYETFTETHYVEVVNSAGAPIAVGERGHLTVTSYASMAAPIIRYKVGDVVTLDGCHLGRVKVSGIRRARDIAIGDSLLPLSVVEGWSEEARSSGHAVRAIQLVRRAGEKEHDELVVRLIGAESPAAIEQWIRGAMMEIPQLRDTLSGGFMRGPVFEVADPDSFEGNFKIPAFVDERPGPGEGL